MHRMKKRPKDSSENRLPGLYESRNMQRGRDGVYEKGRRERGNRNEGKIRVLRYRE